MGQQVGLLERRVVVRPISIVKTISKLTNSFTMMKFLAMFCLFIALFNEMEAKPIEGRTRSRLQEVVSERAVAPSWYPSGSGTDVGAAPDDYAGCGYNCNDYDDDREDEEDTVDDDDGNNSDEETEDEEEEGEEEGADEEDDDDEDEEREDEGEEEEEEEGEEDDDDDDDEGGEGYDEEDC